MHCKAVLFLASCGFDGKNGIEKFNATYIIAGMKPEPSRVAPEYEDVDETSV